MTYDATEILEQAESEQQNILKHTRDAADWFHDREGELFKQEEARDRLADDLNVDDDVAQSLIAELVGDDVDPIVQARAQGVKYVGVAEFKEFDGAYGYLDYHDLYGKRRRVICAQCVHEATHDREVTHATAADPEGSYGPDATYSELLSGIHDHYEDAHDEIPENVETGASLVSGTTIGGNTAWHAGNDGGGSNLNADMVDGNHASDLKSQPSYGDYNLYNDEKSASSSSTATMFSISGSGKISENSLHSGTSNGNPTINVDGTDYTLSWSVGRSDGSETEYIAHIPQLTFSNNFDLILDNSSNDFSGATMNYYVWVNTNY